MPAAVAPPGSDALPLPPAFVAPASAPRQSRALRLVVNRTRLVLPPGSFDPDQTLLEFLRSGAGGAMPRLTGTKLGCAEGGCGACTVVLGKVRAFAQQPSAPSYQYKAVNACLLPLLACHGAHVLTVEGIGTSDQPHPIQERIGKLFGSQCGFCTPGIVMSLYATIRTAHAQGHGLTEEEIEHSLDGNLCRCTGYRPILDAAKTFATAPSSTNRPAQADTQDAALLREVALRSAVCPKGEDCCRVKGAGKANGSCGSNGSASGNLNGIANGQINGTANGQINGTANGQINGTANGQTNGTANGTIKGNPDAALATMQPINPWSTEAQKKFKLYDFTAEIVFPPFLLKRGADWDQDNLAFASLPTPASYYRSTSLAVDADEDEDGETCPPGPAEEVRTLWLRPGSLDALVEATRFYAKLASATGDEGPGFAKLRSGNSETGIEVKFRHMHWNVNLFVSEHLKELSSFVADDGQGSMQIGASVPLQSLIQVLKETNKASSDTAAYPAQLRQAILANLAHFASTQIRNVATLGGNIATASPISDLNPVWIAADAHVHWIDPSAADGSHTGGCAMRDFFLGYRRTRLPPGGIITHLSVPLATPAGSSKFIRAYKQAKRKDDDIAIVTACLGVTVDASTHAVQDVCFAYGGMAPTTVPAHKTREYLLGKTWGASEVFHAALTLMADKDFPLPHNVPGGMAVYRKALALGFFARFWSDVGQQVVKPPSAATMEGRETRDPWALDELPYSEPSRTGATRGRQHLEGVDLAAKGAASGKAYPHLAAMKQVTGEAVYVDDMPKVENEAYGALVMSTRAHAKILGIDKAPALVVPGVLAVLTDEDIPPAGGHNWCPPAMDEPFFARGVVHTFGQVIGVVIAETKAIAQKAARAVKIDYEDLPHLLTIDDAIQAESFFPCRPQILSGSVPDNVEEWVDCEHVLEGETRMGGQEHFYLETNACLAVPGKEDDEMDVYQSTQNPSETQAFVASILGVPNNRIAVHTKRLGGGFGGKESRPTAFAAVLALGARKVGRAVRCMLDRDEDMFFSGQRHPFASTWRVGFQKDGTLVRLDAKVYNNGGWSQDLSQAVLERAMFHIDSCVRIPHLRTRGWICKTNTVSNTAFRGFGGPQGLFINHDILTKVAAHLGTRAEVLVAKNLYKEGDLTHYNQAHEDWNVPTLLSELRERGDYERRRREVDDFNLSHRWTKRGLALLGTKFGISFTFKSLNQAYALVHIHSHDGSVLLSHGGTEMGQGLNTKMAQVCASELGVPLDMVHIVETNTSAVANASPTAASAASDLNGMAIKNACDQLRERLAPYRTSADGVLVPFAKACHLAWIDRVQLSAVGHYATPEIGYVWGTPTSAQRGKPFFYFTQGAALSEVEVDLLTGDHVIRRADIHMDIGRSINPGIDVGQIEGAFTQGYGLTTTEESLWSPATGRPINFGPGNLKIPAFLDTPRELNVSFLTTASRKQHVLRTIQTSKGVGEPPLALGSSVFWAIRDALASARTERGHIDHGEWQFTSPATPENIRLAVGDELLALAQRGTEPKSKDDKPFAVNIF